MDAFIGWLAPICATLVTLAGQLWLNGRFKAADEKRDAARAETEAKRAAEAAWRDSVDKRMDEHDDKIMSMLKSQVTQMRSDLLHRAHRYIDDLGCASIEEKDAFWAEYVEYCELCEQYGIENSFVDELVQRVMSLSEREL